MNDLLICKERERGMKKIFRSDYFSADWHTFNNPIGNMDLKIVDIWKKLKGGSTYL